MRVVILGTGALGCVFAARLAAVGQNGILPHTAESRYFGEVWMLGTWAEGIAAVQQDGIRLREPDGTRWCVHVRATTDPTQVPAADFVLLLVKSYQTGRAAAWAARVLKPDGLAVTLQNGLDNGPKLTAAVGADRAAVGVNYTCATLIGPGETHHTARMPNYIGVTPATAARVATLARLLTAAGLETRVTEAIEGMIWGKALANVAINPLTALWRVPNGALLATPGRLALLSVLVEEAAAVARARGIVLPFADPFAHVEQVCRGTAPNRSSMLQDVERGRPTEIDSLNGVIVAEGKRLGVPTPVNEIVWQLVRGATAETG
jgi:2-dehydropantoate 2-reductase